MAALPDPHIPPSVDLSNVTTIASGIGFETVDLAAFLDQVERQTQDQLTLLASAEEGANRIEAANAAMLKTIDTVSDTTLRTLGAVQTSVDVIKTSIQQTQDMATWVGGIDPRVQTLEQTLDQVVASNTQIAAIAKQVNILAINATIEAARAGDAGRGFAVVADAINELSRKTARAAEGISDNIERLSQWTETMRGEALDMSQKAEALIAQADTTTEALNGIAASTRQTNEDARSITTCVRDVEKASADFTPVFARIGDMTQDTATGVSSARQRLHTMIDSSEAMVQAAAALGGDSPDAAFIHYVGTLAQTIGTRLEQAIEAGRITMGDLLNTNYQAIPNTNPQQHLAAFTHLTDDLLPDLLEGALDFDPKVAFCAAVDRNGYLPTHNKKFSHPPSNDPDWNNGHCRNRRLFNDRVGLKAGQNTAPFLLQVYRRDMGTEGHIMMKDLSVPIYVKGHHWGGLRMGYGV